MKPPDGHVAMMQIDCEVMNTRLLHIHQDSIPAHVKGMRAAENNVSSLQRNDSSSAHHHVDHYDNASETAAASNGNYQMASSGYGSSNLRLPQQPRKYWKRHRAPSRP